MVLLDDGELVDGVLTELDELRDVTDGEDGTVAGEDATVDGVVAAVAGIVAVEVATVGAETLGVETAEVETAVVGTLGSVALMIGRGAGVPSVVLTANAVPARTAIATDALHAPVINRCLRGETFFVIWGVLWLVFLMTLKVERCHLGTVQPTSKKRRRSTADLSSGSIRLGSVDQSSSSLPLPLPPLPLFPPPLFPPSSSSNVVELRGDDVEGDDESVVVSAIVSGTVSAIVSGTVSATVVDDVVEAVVASVEGAGVTGAGVTDVEVTDVGTDCAGDGVMVGRS